MNPKIAKLRTEFEKNKNKISDLQGRNRELEKQYYTISKDIFKDTFNGLYKKRKGVWYQPSDGIQEKRVNPITGTEDSEGSVYWFKKE